MMSKSIQHPVVRAVLRHYGFDEPTDFSVQADLPAAAGLGSSSAFTVSMVNLVSHLMGAPRTRIELAHEAIRIEQVILQENVGVQDQLHASFGGINRFDFAGSRFQITPVDVSGKDIDRLTEWMVLVYSGIQRRASEVASSQIRNTKAGQVDRELREMMHFVDSAQQILEDQKHPADAPARIGTLLTQAWDLKKRLSSEISTSEIDDLYDTCLRAGAIGGKLCGAGGGGFLLMIVSPDCYEHFERVVGKHRCLRFCIDVHGTVLLHSASAKGLSTVPTSNGRRV